MHYFGAQNNPHWCDWQDGNWKDSTLTKFNVMPSPVIDSVTCQIIRQAKSTISTSSGLKIFKHITLGIQLKEVKHLTDTR